MEKLSIFVFLVIAVEVNSLSAPELLKVTALEPPAFYIIWDKVTYKQSDPILGYKIKLWTIQEDVQGEYTLLNADEIPGLIQRSKALEPFVPDRLPSSVPRTVTIEGASTTKSIVKNIKHNVLYEIRVQAYKKLDDGPLSTPRRIKIVKGDDFYAVLQREHNSQCMMTIPSNVTISGNSYLHLDILYM